MFALLPIQIGTVNLMFALLPIQIGTVNLDFFSPKWLQDQSCKHDNLIFIS